MCVCVCVCVCVFIIVIACFIFSVLLVLLFLLLLLLFSFEVLFSAFFLVEGGGRVQVKWFLDNTNDSVKHLNFKRLRQLGWRDLRLRWISLDESLQSRVSIFYIYIYSVPLILLSSSSILSFILDTVLFNSLFFCIFPSFFFICIKLFINKGYCFVNFL